jgi:hypothetical protein
MWFYPQVSTLKQQDAVDENVRIALKNRQKSNTHLHQGKIKIAPVLFESLRAAGLSCTWAPDNARQRMRKLS